MPTLPQILHQPAYHLRWRALLVLLLVVVGAAALAPGTDAPSLGVGDKIDHLLAFSSLAVAAVLSWPADGGRAARAGMGLLAYGALIELAQTQVQGRHADVADLVVDAAGIALGLALVHGLRWRWPATAA